MIPLLTNIPTPDFQLCKTLTIENQYITPIKKKVTGFDWESYSLITELGKMKVISNYVTYNELFKTESINPKAVSSIHISNLLFNGSKPLEGKELEVLNKTFKRLLSKTPTKL